MDESNLRSCSMNYFKDHVKLVLEGITYYYRDIDFLLQAAKEPDPRRHYLALYADAVIKGDQFIKERYIGQYIANTILREYMLTPEHYLCLSDQQRLTLKEGVK